MGANIGYLVHDLSDPAVSRRVRMLGAGGAEVAVAGFSRRDPPSELGGSPAMMIGRTSDARLVQRILAVLRNILRSPAAAVVAGADSIVARNLEMLALAVRLKRPGQRLVYEFLDAHRLLLGTGLASRLLRALERRLLRRCDLVITSSPAYRDQYFRALQGYSGAIELVENKPLEGDALSGDPRTVIQPSNGPPWRIGWFGMLRCRKSLAILRELVTRSEGRVEVVIAGRPAHVEFEDFHRDVSFPGIRFLGEYQASQLPSLYGQVHFAWTVDFFEEGMNSKWLLPNRLYEGPAYDAVPISVRGTEIARWLDRNGIGVVFDSLETELPDFFDSLDPAAYAELRHSVLELPRDRLIATRQESSDIVKAISGR